MEKLNIICENVNRNSEQIIQNLQQENIDVYKFVQREFKKGNISKNTIFQFAFRSFYRLDSAGLTPKFKERFFELFEENAEKKNPNMTETLHELANIRNYKEQKTVQFSFVTKMFHTIDTEHPIYDSEVITVLGYNQPYHITDVTKKINTYNEQYQEICKSYILIKSDKLLRPSIERFNKMFTSHGLNDTMVIDFILWTAGKLIRATKENTTANIRITTP